MKIAFLTPEFPHEKMGACGGIGTSIFNLSKGLLILGHQVIVLVYGQNEDEILEINGIIVHRIKNVKFKGLSWYLTQKKVERLINALIDEDKIDLVEAPDWSGFTSNIKPNCPMVIRLHGSDTYFCYLDNRPVKSINKFRENKALRNADAILSVSQYTADMTKKMFDLSSNIAIIPNGIDLTNFSSNSLNTNLDLSILYFGTLIRKKGALELPAIFNEVYKLNSEVKLILIGKDSSDIISGNQSTWTMMQPLFDTEAIRNVKYIGSVPYAEMKNYIEDATLCVFPTFAEALPVSWIEAMGMGKPIVASNIGWACELIDHGCNGFLEHPLNHKAFAQKINNLLDDKELRMQFSREAKSKANQKYGIENVAKQSVSCYEKIILNKK